jgi:serine/threonine-protein kinase
MSSPALSFAPGTLIGDRYRIEALIGEGGFGAVFRAVQLALDRPVALKVMLPDLLANDGLARFQREAELGQRLEHPNTVRLLDFGRAGDGSPYLVFELLKGQTLERAIHDAGRLPVPRVHRVATQMLKALMEAHSLGIVHRDLKPANVFLCNFQGEVDFVKVLDFGIAKGSGLRPLTQRGQVVGTPAYMAPEQVMGHEATFASDLYALGLLMSEALAGAPVFQGASGADIAREQMSANAVPHAPEVVSSPLGRVILRATQKQPERRYASAAAMLADLEAPAGGPPPARARRSSRRPRPGSPTR